MNLPNRLTMIRFLLAIPFIMFLQASDSSKLGFIFRMISLVIFVQLEYIPGWMSIIVLAREFLISGIRILAAAKGEIIAAGNLGKYKTTSQMLVIVIALAIGPIGFTLAGHFFTIAEVLMLIPVILTIWSGWEYTFKAKHYFLEQ